MNDDLNRPQGRYFEELTPGTVIRHRVTRTITEADNVFFTTLTMNPQPLHLDREYAAATEFGQPLVNSMLTLSLLVGLSVPELTLGTLVANLGLTDVVFPKPVFHGDTIRAESEVLEARESRSRPNAGLVTVEHRAINQRDEVVARCKRTALMQKKPSAVSR
ncbi:MaoC family dehydratase [Deinococcus metallilatus]|uniref:Acyl dehydratase n=1 Tax=Deinococcus metallilatus TaxID=1211322 RepID=A0AAJ5F442_9DEIO|nr:MaoC family dehydratase [Deinococcus metallilatus]MBB5295145.1 acyl dehydratase [Deinococcus metallilatus]QBY08679.1 MaoC family dehydratase [Deinococcus metallilatus]RXJ10558.1 MaoC family dehydratase [Deinococcus metallilatus]TLK26529.1 MaoC family dehydratase [Deinococcus metallilatus]GMA14918.1 MaoC family dehydratase [Deinococcus metallilatus]